MNGTIFILLFVMYLITSKVILLPQARKDVQIDYKAGSISDRLYILLMLPIYYTKG